MRRATIVLLLALSAQAGSVGQYSIFGGGMHINRVSVGVDYKLLMNEYGDLRWIGISVGYLYW